MPVISEAPRVEQWLFSVLTGDTALAAAIGARVYVGAAPNTATFPLVIFAQISPGDDLRGVGPVRVWGEPLYVVKAVGQGQSVQSLAPLADRIDAVLHAVSGTVSDGRIHFCERERGFRRTEVIGDQFFQHLGGEHRVGAGPLTNP